MTPSNKLLLSDDNLQWYRDSSDFLFYLLFILNIYHNLMNSMKYYAVCKECGFHFENKESGFYYCPQCEKEMKFLKLELFDGVKPSEIHEKD